MQIQWSKFARTEQLSKAGSNLHPTQIGYIEQALHIAEKPGAFADADIEKAIRVFLGQQMYLAAKSLQETYMRLRDARDAPRFNGYEERER